MRRKSHLDTKLREDLVGLAHEEDPYDTVVGKTMCTDDFYEGESLVLEQWINFRNSWTEFQ